MLKLPKLIFTFLQVFTYKFNIISTFLQLFILYFNIISTFLQFFIYNFNIISTILYFYNCQNYLISINNFSCKQSSHQLKQMILLFLSSTLKSIILQHYFAIARDDNGRS